MLNYFNFLAGIALMLLGIHSLRQGSERLFGARLRRLLQSATKDSGRSLLAGLLVSIVMPSSTAVALLSMEAINAGYMTFQHGLVLMLGANVGFTVTVQLLAFKFYIYNAVFIVSGAPFYLFGKRLNVRGAGQALLGTGFLLLALQVLSAAVAPLKGNADVGEVMRVFASHPVWLVMFAMVLDIILQSPTATIGIGLALCAQGILPVEGAVAVVLGANLGLGLTALVAGSAKVDTRRMAVGNLIFTLAGVIVCVPLVPVLVPALRALSPSGDTQAIANADTLFNVALAVVFLPLVPLLARLLERLIPSTPPGEGGTGPRYLDPAALESPALALGQATREILHMADHVQAMFRDAYRCFKEADVDLCATVQRHDDIVDSLDTEIKAFITKISEQALNHEESKREVALLAFCNELESIGDIIDKNLVELAKKKISLSVDFSKDGWVELDGFFHEVLENLEIAVAAFASHDRELAEKLLRHKHNLNEHELELRNRHFHRLHAGLAESIETSAIHLDVLTNLKHINSHLTAVAYPILEDKVS
ncbi:MAG: Na/Pi cotransporter family protein [Verrucomicrobiia bacterium]